MWCSKRILFQSKAVRRLSSLSLDSILSELKQYAIPPPCSRVVVAMSGGVDSSVTAYLLKKHFKCNVTGVFMKNWDEPDETGNPYQCSAAKDFVDVERVCKQLSIPCHQVDFVQPYWNEVFLPYLDRFKDGGTPNADNFCNREIKFNHFKQLVEEKFDAEYIATGHYARLLNVDSKQNPQLLTGLDPVKDQSYFLCAVPGLSLRNVSFPLGALHKSVVRQIAAHAGLATACKKDSVGICFVGKRKFDRFINEYLDPIEGRFHCVEENIDLGPHKGLHLYTIGQKARISGVKQKYFVVEKNADSGIVFVAPGSRHPALYASSLKCNLKDVFWISGELPIVSFILKYSVGELDCY